MKRAIVDNTIVDNTIVDNTIVDITIVDITIVDNRRRTMNHESFSSAETELAPHQKRPKKKSSSKKDETQEPPQKRLKKSRKDETQEPPQKRPKKKSDPPQKRPKKKSSSIYASSKHTRLAEQVTRVGAPQLIDTILQTSSSSGNEASLEVIHLLRSTKVSKRHVSLWKNSATVETFSDKQIGDLAIRRETVDGKAMEGVHLNFDVAEINNPLYGVGCGVLESLFQSARKEISPLSTSHQSSAS